MSKLIKKKFKIGGMHCSSCAMNIDFDLEDLEGVTSAKTYYAQQVCEIEFDEHTITITQIKEQILKTGYPAEEAPE